MLNMRAGSQPVGHRHVRNIFNNIGLLNNQAAVRINRINVKLQQYNELKQKSFQFQLQFALPQHRQIDYLIKNTDRSIRKVIDSLNLPIVIDNKLYYVYDTPKKLYKQTDIRFVIEFILQSLETLTDNIIQQIENTIANIVDQTQIPPLQRQIDSLNKTMNKLENSTNICRIINKMCLSFSDDYRLQLFNCHPTELPLSNRRKINVLNKLISPRNENDFFTFEARGDYLRHLISANNVYVQFKRSQFPIEEEYKWERLLDAYNLSVFNHEEIFANKVNEYGGNGKDTEIKALRYILIGSKWIREIDRKLLLTDSFNAGAERQKLRNARLVYFQELDDKKTFNVSAAKEISSTGIVDTRDCHQSGRNIEPFFSTHCVVSYGNYVNESALEQAAFKRRYLSIHMKTYARNPGDNGFDINDDNCIRKDLNLPIKLEQNPSHILTYLINVQHEYFQKIMRDPNFSLKETIPISMTTPDIDKYDRFLNDYVEYENQKYTKLRDIFDSFARKENIQITKSIEKKIKTKLLKLNNFIEIKNKRFDNRVHLTVFNVVLQEINNQE
eukprot:437498_1